MNICYFGAGKLGLSLAVWDAHQGHHVVCVDVNEDTVKAINTGQSPIDEPGVQVLLKQVRDTGHLWATCNSTEDFGLANIIFVLVPTPSNPDGSFSLEYIEQVAGVIGRGLWACNKPPLVVCVSTIMPGDSRKIIKIIEDESGLKCGEDWHYCYSPEFVAQGSIVHDYAGPSVLLIGEHSQEAGYILEKFYLSVVTNHPDTHHMSLESAEVAKIGLNTAVVAKMAVANQLMWLCHRVPGADAGDVLHSIGSDLRIGRRYFKGGTWPGGPCFPRDQRAIVAAGRAVGVDLPVASAIDRFHAQQCEWLAQEALCHLRRVSGSTIGILGLTYKPGVSLMDESQGLALASKIASLDEDTRVLLWDPATNDGLEYVIKGSDVFVVMVDHPELVEIETMDLTGKVIVDCWGCIQDARGAERIVLGEGKVGS